jgi:hypothetical protein
MMQTRPDRTARTSGAELVHAGLELSLVLGSGTALETQRFTLESKE